MTMLTIEGRDPMRWMLREMPHSAYPGSAVIEADNAEAAIELCNAGRPRLVLMDATLPDNDAVALIGRLKPLLSDTAVIAVSSNPGQAGVRRALATGAFACVAKDKLYRELPPTMASALRPKQIVAAPGVRAEIVRAH